MPLIVWTEEYSVNIREIDNQHKRWFAILNKLFDAKGSNQETGILSDILTELMEYAKIHFATEEKYFKAYGYPDADSHVKEHEAFIKKVGDFKQSFERSKTGLDVSVLNYLLNWLKNHIQGSDRAYGPYLNEKGVR